jgi:hypothetical protein
MIESKDVSTRQEHTNNQMQQIACMKFFSSVLQQSESVTFLFPMLIMRYQTKTLETCNKCVPVE